MARRSPSHTAPAERSFRRGFARQTQPSYLFLDTLVSVAAGKLQALATAEDGRYRPDLRPGLGRCGRHHRQGASPYPCKCICTSVHACVSVHVCARASTHVYSLCFSLRLLLESRPNGKTAAMRHCSGHLCTCVCTCLSVCMRKGCGGAAGARRWRALAYTRPCTRIYAYPCTHTHVCGSAGARSHRAPKYRYYLRPKTHAFGAVKSIFCVVCLIFFVESVKNEFEELSLIFIGRIDSSPIVNCEVVVLATLINP